MEPTTLVFPIKDNKILLGLKKRGFGKDKFNGFGGKVKKNETHRECACRELTEEANIMAKTANLKPIAFIDFRFPFSPELTHYGYVYFVEEYLGNPLESEEMIPMWFDFAEIPYDQMWKGDKMWLPQLLQGQPLVGYVSFAEDNENIVDIKLIPVANISENEHLNYEGL